MSFPVADPAIGTVLVTATRTPQRADKMIPDTTVIASDEISRAGPGSVARLLRRQRGIEIVRNGGPGSSTSVFLRGANSNQGVVLVDGMRIGSSTTGAASWNAIPLPSIDHIEIVYGPLSSLYGADAIGGVVQIFTKKSEGTPAFSASQVDAAVHGSTAGEHSVSYALSGAREDANGFSFTRPGSPSYNKDDDGYTRDSMNGRLAIQLAPDIEAGALFLKSRLRAQYDIGAELQTSGSRFDDAANVDRLGGYGLLNLYTTWRFAPDWSLPLRLDNAADKHYEPARNYGTAARSWSAALRCAAGSVN
jgi:vitamin B12 transporter